MGDGGNRPMGETYGGNRPMGETYGGNLWGDTAPNAVL